MFVDVCQHTLDINGYQNRLHEHSTNAGAIVTFCGLVRDFNHAGCIDGIHLEHYPGMTEKALNQLLCAANTRFDLLNAGIVHRVGDIANHEVIVWVGTSAYHRQAAFDGASYMMDMLKQSVPLWKKEYQGGRGVWVHKKHTDELAAMKWLQEASGTKESR
ncbi:molybdenum cofactor biosynthesis protein MoaE [Aestuariibacter sp. A3R04]|uniref:molybdenum cofactor biosynthesis protein MoaE n=1 Tax=Aestuariibacter sp. A3R04 TaxID=2841571 RepID=UPI001C092F73|nr:molybdenum cofactor biosynthesis protein MoaE [Aestuariibacter sp. A3R04]MBU3023191.1 molybdenum cofactor biosynthesis protein MoaE [Aestuariibacter sp. A3R04]